MVMKYKSLKEVLSTINNKKDLNKDNIIEEIKTELEKQDRLLYSGWKMGKFDVNYVFSPYFYIEYTLLTIAAEYGHVDIVKVLLEKGANVNEKDFHGCTALHFAAKYGHVDIVEVLLKEGAKVDSVDQCKRTPLHNAAENGYANIVNALIKAGANVNEKDFHGCTALHVAARSGHEKTVKVLLQAEEDVNAVDRYGRTPLDRAEGYAKEYGEDYAESKNVVKALLEAGGGSFVKARNKSMIAGGVTALLGAAIAVALFTTGIITAQLIPIVIAVVAVTAAELVVGCATYALLKPSTKVDGAEKPSAVLTTNEQQKAAV
ncbi:MAG: ankyrin repeat domain-containing protein [Wolbachia sp.]